HVMAVARTGVCSLMVHWQECRGHLQCRPRSLRSDVAGVISADISSFKLLAIRENAVLSANNPSSLLNENPTRRDWNAVFLVCLGRRCGRSLARYTICCRRLQIFSELAIS